MERSILSWKEPFEIGKLEMKLERYVAVGKTSIELEEVCSSQSDLSIFKIRNIASQTLKRREKR